MRAEGIELIPSNPDQEHDYIERLVASYTLNKTTPEELAKAMSYCRHFWVGYTGGHKCGIIYLCFFPELNLWTLDAYRDNKYLATLRDWYDWSFNAGKLVCDFYFIQYKERDSLYTTHDERNVLATRMCQRLGFKITSITKTGIGNFVILRRDR